MKVEILRRLTTISGENPNAVWDARIVDERSRILWACDHGHPTAALAIACATAQIPSLRVAS